jgi:hypothetical protein
MADAINKQVVALLSSLTTEEFAKIFADVAKTTLKDPKQLQQALKSFRLAENLSEIGEVPEPDQRDIERGAAARANPTANTASTIKAGLNVSKSFTSMLAAAMKLKGVNPNQLVKKAFDSLPKERFALQPQQMNMAMGKAIEVINKIMTTRAATANDPNVGTSPAKPAPAKPTAPVPAAAPATVQENKEINRWKKLAGIIKG